MGVIVFIIIGAIVYYFYKAYQEQSIAAEKKQAELERKFREIDYRKQQEKQWAIEEALRNDPNEWKRIWDRLSSKNSIILQSKLDKEVNYFSEDANSSKEILQAFDYLGYNKVVGSKLQGAYYIYEDHIYISGSGSIDGKTDDVLCVEHSGYTYYKRIQNGSMDDIINEHMVNSKMNSARGK